MEKFSIHNLEDLESLAESEEVEFKLAHGKDGTGELPQDFWRSYSAMANAHGGWIILGVKEKNGQFTVAGLDNIEKIKTNLFNLLNNRNHISANLLLSPENIQIQTLDKKKILVIQIPQAVRKQKPVHLTKNPFGNTYIRIHDGDRLCDDDLIKRMLAEQLNSSRDLDILSEHYLFEEDIELDSLNAYRNRLSAHKPNHPFLDLTLFEFFKKIGGWRKDRGSGKAGMTLAGLLMFGKFNSITDACPNYFLDYREPNEDCWQERIFYDGSWSGNLFDFYRKVYPKLTADLKVPLSNVYRNWPW